MKDAVEIEKEFIIEALPCDLIGMNKEKMGEYIAARIRSILGRCLPERRRLALGAHRK